MIVLVVRLEVSRTGRNVHVFAVDTPDTVHAPGMRTGSIVVGNLARCFRLADIPDIKTGRRARNRRATDLVRHDQIVAADFERVGAHLVVRQIGLHDYFGVGRIGDIDTGKVLWRAFVPEPHDAAAIRRFRHPHALADAAEATEVIVADQFHVK